MIFHSILPAAQRVARLALWLTLAACLGRLGGYAWARVQALLAARVEDWFESVKADLSRLAAEVAAGDWQPSPPATERQRPAEPKPRSDRLPETLGRKPPRTRRQNRPPDAPEATAPARPQSQPPPQLRPDRPPLLTWRRERRPGAPAQRAIPRPSESQKRGKSAPTSPARP